MTELQSKVRSLFDAHDIDILLAWRQIGKGVQPAVFKPGDSLDSLVFDKRCIDNLTNYLPELTERYKKVGVVLKGCDGRALVTQLVEHRIDKNRILALGVACDGVEIEGTEAQKCVDCATNIAPVVDIVLGEKREKGAPKFENLKELEQRPPEERWKTFAEHFSKCTRCYACRQVCPLCYCEVCIVDQQEPTWIEPSAKLSANTMWHLVRAYHLAGRCADCGECERVCPEGLPLRLLNTALEKAVLDMFKVRPGTVPEEQPPLVTLNKDDPDSIMEKKNA